MPEFDPIIHQPVRLRITASLAALAQGESVEFTFLRDLLDLTDGNLGAHLHKLEDAGYVEIEKTFVDRKPKSFISLTAKGQRAFNQHVQALREILDDSG
ncbi:MAG: transcriptional regulator [Anaerolineales bacterium]|jgi:DNA-binding MarR family transcriptional regulator